MKTALVSYQVFCSEVKEPEYLKCNVSKDET